MSTGVGVVDGVVAAVAILVQTIDGFGVQVIGCIGGNESTPFGGVISGVAIIQAGIFVVVVAIGTKIAVFTIGKSAYLFYHLLRS